MEIQELESLLIGQNNHLIIIMHNKRMIIDLIINMAMILIKIIINNSQIFKIVLKKIIIKKIIKLQLL